MLTFNEISNMRLKRGLRNDTPQDVLINCYLMWAYTMTTGKSKPVVMQWLQKTYGLFRFYNNCAACDYNFKMFSGFLRKSCAQCPLLPLWFGVDRYTKIKSKTFCACERLESSPYRQTLLSNNKEHKQKIADWCAEELEYFVNNQTKG